MIRFERTNGPASPSLITALEEQLGAKLPADYSAFLRQDNGGRPLEYEVTIPDWGATVINNFYGVGAPGRSSLEFQSHRTAHRLPEAIIPIGDDPAGNYFCIGLQTPRAGKVFFWDHEQLNEDEMAELVEVAQSFSEFISGVRRC
jgi:cell wall assembly regulator SMI1